jgi:hypothetical protein
MHLHVSLIPLFDLRASAFPFASHSRPQFRPVSRPLELFHPLCCVHPIVRSFSSPPHPRPSHTLPTTRMPSCALLGREKEAPGS